MTKEQIKEFPMTNYFKDKRRTSFYKDRNFKDWYGISDNCDVINAAQCFALLWGPLVPFLHHCDSRIWVYTFVQPAIQKDIETILIF